MFSREAAMQGGFSKEVPLRAGWAPANRSDLPGSQLDNCPMGQAVPGERAPRKGHRCCLCGVWQLGRLGGCAFHFCLRHLTSVICRLELIGTSRVEAVEGGLVPGRAGVEREDRCQQWPGATSPPFTHPSLSGPLLLLFQPVLLFSVKATHL